MDKIRTEQRRTHRVGRAWDALFAAEVRRLAAELRLPADPTPALERSTTRMPRVIVTTDAGHREPPRTVLDEFVDPIHLESGPSAAAFVERLGWAVSDAREAELGTRAGGPLPSDRAARGRPPS